MKNVILIFALVFVSTFGFVACDNESDFEEIQMDLPTSDSTADDEEEEPIPYGG